MYPFQTNPGFVVFTRLHFETPFYLGQYGRSALVHTRRHEFMYYVDATPVCLFAGGFGAQDVVGGGWARPDFV